MAAVTSYSQTGNAYIDGILDNLKWAVSNLTFSFPTNGSHYGSGYGSGETADNFGALNTTQQAVVRSSLKMYASVANLSFTEIAETATQHADLRFAESDLPGTAWAYFPTTAAEGGDVWFNSTDYNTPMKGNYASLTFVHEIGHALGLEHPHQGSTIMPLSRDSMEYTVMSYRSYIGASTTSGYVNETWSYAQSLMMYDIAALQHMYGANYTTNSGNTTYKWNSATGEMMVNGVGQGAPGGNKILLTVWDGGGTDTYDFSNYTSNLKVDLRPGQWTNTSTAQLAKLHYDGSKVAVGNIASALLYKGDTRSLIERAIGGSGSDTVTGNVSGNILRGNGGDDTLYGLAGADTLIGGGGKDYLNGGADYDVVEYSGLSADYTWIRNANGAWITTDLRAGSLDGVDTLIEIEALKFSDRSITLQDVGTTTITEDPIGQDIFRFYNAQTQSHFYTASAAEKDQVIASYPQFTFEGNVFDTTATSLNGVNVFRFYNTQTKTHFYTASAAERDYVIATYAQFRFEGAAYYAYANDGGGQHEALYRFYNQQTKAHFYTASELERDQVIAKYSQYKYEGTAFYVDLA
ncbi:protease [Microvirga sp. KLBC 81]|uniref:M10 family metallopeptidase C-terminal domain-containing protein n=1 Tax=Microvirga sp. KLBC 81 TaxID=1862707 RepID=UPI000D5068DC|nr:M10 family metallopeptidase C-terminal domain-containing protein [Microvirga sp. KLBC 81]PVE21381.1 protease [Microvirga sp. KLBC 81]